MALVQITLAGGPYDGRIIELHDPGPTIQAATPQPDGGIYVQDGTEPTLYTWTPGAAPVPSPNDPLAEPPLPQAVQDAIADFQTFLSVPNGTATNAQRDAILKGVIQALRYLNRRFE